MMNDNNKEQNDMNDVTERLRSCAINYATALDAFLTTQQPKQESLDPDYVEDEVAKQLSEHDFGDQIQDAVDNADFSDAAEDAASNVDYGNHIDDHFQYNSVPTNEDRVAEIVEEGVEVKLFEHHLFVLQSMDNFDHWKEGVEGAAVNKYKEEIKEKIKEEESVSV